MQKVSPNDPSSFRLWLVHRQKWRLRLANDTEDDHRGRNSVAAIQVEKDLTLTLSFRANRSLLAVPFPTLHQRLINTFGKSSWLCLCRKSRTLVGSIPGNRSFATFRSEVDPFSITQL